MLAPHICQAVTRQESLLPEQHRPHALLLFDPLQEQLAAFSGLPSTLVRRFQLLPASSVPQANIELQCSI